MFPPYASQVIWTYVFDCDCTMLDNQEIGRGSSCMKLEAVTADICDVYYMLDPAFDMAPSNCTREAPLLCCDHEGTKRMKSCLVEGLVDLMQLTRSPQFTICVWKDLRRKVILPSYWLVLFGNIRQRRPTPFAIEVLETIYKCVQICLRSLSMLDLR